MADETSMTPIEFGVPDVAAFYNGLNDAVNLLDQVADAAGQASDEALVERCDRIIAQLEFALASMKGKSSSATRRAMVGPFLR